MWAAGIAAGAVPIAMWQIVGSGFHRLVAATAAMMGSASLIFGFSVGTAVGLLMLLTASVLVRRPVLMATAFAVAAIGFLITASSGGNALLAVSGAATLGAVTDEMLLGHWYLVDPRLPRWALKSLDVAALVGLVADAALLAALGAFTWESSAFVVGWSFVVMTAMSALLMIGVWFAIREPGYNGVMAATGLSYLAVLTVIAATISGRSLIGEGSSLLSG